MLDTGTYSRNTLGNTYSGELDGEWSDHHDWAYFEIDSDEDDPDSPPSGSGSSGDKGGLPSEPSQFDAAGYLNFTKRIEIVGPVTFMRLNVGVATEHRWLDEL